MQLRCHDVEASLLEGVMCRGDRRLGEAIELAWRRGARFDAWDEHFSFQLWLEAFEEEGLDPAWYAQRDIPLDEALPWDHLSCGVTREFLARDYGLALSGKTVADCHWGPCFNCGVPTPTGFECRTGEQGPRQLLVRPEAGEAEPGDGVAAEEGSSRWRYVGPPGDPRRHGSVGGAAAGTSPGDAAVADASDNAEDIAMSWPSNLLGTKVQSKNAGLSGLASLVDAAGGESTG